jgi:hypothetical protein
MLRLQQDFVSTGTACVTLSGDWTTVTTDMLRILLEESRALTPPALRLWIPDR